MVTAHTPYDGHTLQGTIDEAAHMTRIELARIYVKWAYSGHNYQENDGLRSLAKSVV